MPSIPSSTAQQGLPAWLGALWGVLVGVVFGLLGYLLLRRTASPEMGNTMFVLLPLVVGATIALVTPSPVAAVALLSGTISLFIFMFSVIMMHMEGTLCAITAFPLVFLALLAGVGVGLLLRKIIRSFQNVTTNLLILLAAPAVILGGQRMERGALTQARTESVTTTVHLPARPEEVWTNIQSVDKLAARRPLLMHLGLPVPLRCELKGTSVGSKRICYFDQGWIEETILDWNPPVRMRLVIDRTNMPGGHWLEFDGAEYDLRGDPTGTTITRVTTVRSNLRPGWYWGLFEMWGVKSEHQYLFSDLARKFPEGR